MTRLLSFDEAWMRLAAEGVCDPRGGVDYRRIFDAWRAEHHPAEVEEFIRARLLQGATK